MKNKSHKGLLKRVRITKTGLVSHRTTGHKHLRSGKGGKRLRQMRKDPFMANPSAKRHEKLLFRRLRGRTQPRSAIKPSPSPEQSKAIKAAKKAALAAAASGTTVAVASTKTTGPKAKAVKAPAATKSTTTKTKAAK